jgi:hypothetical protein
MSIKDIHIHMFHSNILLSSSISEDDYDKLQKAITYYEYIRQCWKNYKKKSSINESRTIDVQYQSSILYLDSFCQKFKSEIKVLSFQFLNDVINWFHSNKILFTVHDCHEYEVNSMTNEQLESLNSVIINKYGERIKFVSLD